MKIYTKTGDQGQTGLYGGERVSKADLRVEVYGTVDELNAQVAVALCEELEQEKIMQLSTIQFNLFTLGSEVATPTDKLYLASGKPRLSLVIQQQDIEQLEQWMDQMEEFLDPLKYFILPGGGRASSLLHVCRTVTRRAERHLVALAQNEQVRAELLVYLNRLSDYFFVLSRYVAKTQGKQEVVWNPNSR